MKAHFNGFPKACLAFLADLEAHNDRDWFKDNKPRFEKSVLTPAREYVTAMGERLQKVVPGIQAIPMVDKSIFRVHRDTRFSGDKKPFKTHLGIFLWEGDGRKLDCPGFYLHLEKDKLLVGGGIHIFSKELLDIYRAFVDDQKHGGRLEKILKDAAPYFGDVVHSDAYKRVPRGYPADHPRGALLKNKGVTLGETTAIPDALHTSDALDYVYERFERILPLHRWLRAMTAALESGAEPPL